MLLIYDKDKSITEISKTFGNDGNTPEQNYEKVKRIFAFWSVYLSHAGLARYLQQGHSVRALKKLEEQHENSSCVTANGHIPFNFTFVRLVAELYNSGKIDRAEIERCIKRYGEHSALLNFLRVVFHIYAYYRPLSIDDKQWLSNKLSMSLKKIEVQRLKAIESKKAK